MGKENRETLFNATFFASMYMYDENKKLRNPKVTSENQALVNMLQYCRYFAIKNVSALEYMIVAIHNHDLVGADSKELDANGKSKYKKGDTKALHIHVAMKFQRNQGKTQSAIAKQFYKALNVHDTDMQIKKHNRHVEVTADEGAMLHYLTHTNQPKKTPYGLQNLFITRVQHRSRGKVKYVISEDFKEVKNDVNAHNFWVTSLSDYLYLGDGGREKVQELPQQDMFDSLSKIATKQGLKWELSGRDFDNAECRLTRQSGNATKWFLDYRTKFKTKQGKNVLRSGGKAGGSSFYHGQLPLHGGKNHETTEIDQICLDLQLGKIKFYQVKQALVDDFGAQGAIAWDKNKNNVFTEAVADWVESRVRDIDDITKPDKRQLSVIYTTGDGGSGKDYYTTIERQLLTGDVDAHQMTTSGKKKTPDMFKNWGNRLHSVGSDVDGSNFECHEFTQVFDTSKAPVSASGRNNNSPYLPNFVWFNNSIPLSGFVTDSLTHSDRDKYAKFKFNDKNNRVYDYGALNDYKHTMDMRTQMLRRIPYYQQFVTNPYDQRFQRCRLFFYVPYYDEHVLFDEFECRTLKTVEDEQSRADEALRVANRLVDDIKQYDFASFFGDVKKLPYEKLLTVYDFKTESIKKISAHKVFLNEISDYHRVHHIPSTQDLSEDQERQLFTEIKFKAQKTYADIVNNADFERRDLMDKCQFYVDVLSDYQTELESQEALIDEAQRAIDYARLLQSNIGNHKLIAMPNDYQIKNWIADGSLKANYGYNNKRFSRRLSEALNGHKTFVDVASAQGARTSGVFYTKASCDFVIMQLAKLIVSVRRAIANDGIREQIAFDFSNAKYLPVAGDSVLKNVDQLARPVVISKLQKQLQNMMQTKSKNGQLNSINNPKIV